MPGRVKRLHTAWTTIAQAPLWRGGDYGAIGAAWREPAQGITPPDAPEWKEWNAAIDEYFALERKAKGENAWGWVQRRRPGGVYEMDAGPTPCGT